MTESTVTDNESGGEGSLAAGIRSSGELTLIDSTVSYKTDPRFDPRPCVVYTGGGIDSSGDCDAINTTVFGNSESTCVGLTNGGGISARGERR